MAKNMSSTAYDWNGQPSSPTVPYATAVTSEPMHVNGNGNTSPPPPTVAYANAYTVPEKDYDSLSKSQTPNTATLPNSPQSDHASQQAAYPPQVSYTTYQISTLGATPSLIADSRPRCRYCGGVGPPTLVSTRPSCTAWVFFVLLLVTIWPLCWIPLVACHKRNYRCSHCRVSWAT